MWTEKRSATSTKYITHTHTDPSNLDFNLYINPCYHTVPVPVNSMTIVWCGGGCTHTHWFETFSRSKLSLKTILQQTWCVYCGWLLPEKKTSKLKIVTNQNMIKLKSVVVCCCCCCRCFHILQIYGTRRSFFFSGQSNPSEAMMIKQRKLISFIIKRQTDRKSGSQQQGLWT